MPSSGNYVLIYDQCHNVLIGLNTIRQWKRNHGLNGASLSSAETAAGYPNKNSNNRKMISARGDDGKREKASLPFFPFPSLQAHFLFLSLQPPYDAKESLSNDDGDGNEDGKKAIGLDWRKSNFARASRFFVHFFAVVARLQRESA